MKNFSPAFLLSAFLLSSLLGASAAQAKLVDKTLALINADVILQSDMNAFRKNFALRREIDPFIPFTTISPDNTKDVLGYLVQEKLVLQKSPATEEEIEEEINSVQKNNKIAREQLKEVLRAQGVDFEDYRRLMGISVSKRKLVERELRPLAAVSDEDVKNQYYSTAATQARPKEQRLVLTYGFQQLILPNRELSDEASRRLKAGEDFDAVATDLSGKGAESSRLNEISEENMNPAIKSAIQGVKAGEITKAIPAGSGYMLLKITSIGAPKDPTFERERDNVRGMLFQKALINQLKIWTERERAAAYVHISAN